MGATTAGIVGTLGAAVLEPVSFTQDGSVVSTWGDEVAVEEYDFCHILCSTTGSGIGGGTTASGTGAFTLSLVLVVREISLLSGTVFAGTVDRLFSSVFFAVLFLISKLNFLIPTPVVVVVVVEVVDNGIGAATGFDSVSLGFVDTGGTVGMGSETFAVDVDAVLLFPALLPPPN